MLNPRCNSCGKRTGHTSVCPSSTSEYYDLLIANPHTPYTLSAYCDMRNLEAKYGITELEA